jgi:small-conductance mechanosensitive channel
MMFYGDEFPSFLPGTANPEKVREVLLEIARSHEFVPVPRVLLVPTFADA